MATEIVMPQMGAEMEEGTVVRWLKQPGDLITRGETIAEIETDKATVDLESFEEGYFLGSVVADGTTVPVGTLIGYLGAQGEQLPAGRTAPAPAASQPADAAASSSEPPTERAPASAAAQATPAMPSQAGAGAAPPAGQPVTARTDAAPASAPAAGAEAETVPARTQQPAASAAQQVQTAPPVPVGTANGAHDSAATGRVRVSPVARSIAEEMGIDLRQVRGSGPDGRVMRRDVEEFARTHAQAPAEVQTAPEPATAEQEAHAAPEAPAAAGGAAPPRPAPPAAAVPTPAAPARPAGAPVQAPASAAGLEPLSKMRQAIARRMAAAKRDIPHYYVTMSVDMTDAMALRKQLNDSLGEDAKLSVNDLIVKACALAIEKYRQFNSFFDDAGGQAGLRRSESINIGVAVALPDGLIVPVVLNCQGKSLGAIARQAHDVVERARNGRLRQQELSDGTFTISNLGMYGVETLIAIIQPGQAAILGVGKVEPRPVARAGEVVVREMMTIALSADHRVTDGAQGAQFTAEIRDLLEHPMRLVL